MSRAVDVLVIGAGPAGLASALELRRRGVRDVLVLDRERSAGGAPRSLGHLGFGMRDLRKVLSGPAYARSYAELADKAGLEVQLETTATAWTGPTTLTTTSAAGLSEIEAGAVVLATGCRERPRSARLVPGSRPLGVLTTGALQRSVTMYRQPVGKRAVVVGAEHVSFAAALSLAEAGATGTTLVTEHPVDQTYPWLRFAVAARTGCQVLTSTRVTDVIGRHRVESVEIMYLPSGRRRRIACDTLVFSGEWIPEHELARLGGLQMDSGTRGPSIDLTQRTSARGVFAAGNMLHAAQMADQAALCGRYVAEPVVEFLRTGSWPDQPGVSVRCEPPVAWISPDRVGPEESARLPHGSFVLRVSEVLERPRLEVVQGRTVVWAKGFKRLRPGLPLYIPGALAARLRQDGGPATVRIV